MLRPVQILPRMPSKAMNHDVSTFRKTPKMHLEFFGWDLLRACQLLFKKKGIYLLNKLVASFFVGLKT